MESVGKGLISTFKVRYRLISTFEHYVRYGRCRLGNNLHLGGTLELDLHPSSTELEAESVGEGLISTSGVRYRLISKRPALSMATSVPVSGLPTLRGYNTA